MVILAVCWTLLAACLGTWLWSLHGERRSARAYSPATGTWTAPACVVTAVYDTPAALFNEALSSWIDNDAVHVIAVIDEGNPACVALFKQTKALHPERAFSLVSTNAPGKRAAIAEGVALVNTGIVVLTDADTVWSASFLAEILKPFADTSVGAVAGRDLVLRPRTVAQHAYATIQDFACGFAIPARVAQGARLDFLTGRGTAYRLETLRPALEGLLNEQYRGRVLESGDDIYLAHAVSQKGWKTAYQSTAVCRTAGARGVSGLFLQIVRWSRGFLRAREMKYFDNGAAKPAGKAWGTYGRLFGYLLVPPALITLALDQQPMATIALATTILCTSGAALKMSGEPCHRAIARSAWFTIAQTMLSYGLGYAYITKNTEGWHHAQ